MCDMTYLDVWNESFRCVTWLFQMCDMTHSGGWHDAFRCVTWLIHMCDMTHIEVYHDAFRFVTWLIQMCDMTLSDVWQLIRICDMTHLKVWHDSFRCVISIMQTCDLTHSDLWQDALRCVTPRTEGRGLKIGGGDLIHRKVVFWILRCSRFERESLAIIWVPEYFVEITNSKTKWPTSSCGKRTLCCA